MTVTFSATNDNPGLFMTPPAVAPDGTLSYKPAQDAYGVANVTVTAIDDGGTANGGVTDTSAPVTFALTVDPVNDTPSFVAGGNQTVVSLLGHRRSPAGRRESRRGLRTSRVRRSASPSRTIVPASSRRSRRSRPTAR